MLKLSPESVQLAPSEKGVAEPTQLDRYWLADVEVSGRDFKSGQCGLTLCGAACIDCGPVPLSVYHPFHYGCDGRHVCQSYDGIGNRGRTDDGELLACGPHGALDRRLHASNDQACEPVDECPASPRRSSEDSLLYSSLLYNSYVMSY